MVARSGVEQRLVKLPFTVENMISAGPAGGRHMHLLPSVIFHEAQLVKFLIVNAVWNTCHGILLQDSYLFKQSEGDENFACKDTTPSFLLNPEHQLHRGLQNIFFPFTRVDRLAWNYFIIQTCLHVQLALVCTAPAKAHSVSRRSNFLNLRG